MASSNEQGFLSFGQGFVGGMLDAYNQKLKNKVSEKKWDQTLDLKRQKMESEQKRWEEEQRLKTISDRNKSLESGQKAGFTPQFDEESGLISDFTQTDDQKRKEGLGYIIKGAPYGMAPVHGGEEGLIQGYKYDPGSPMFQKTQGEMEYKDLMAKVATGGLGVKQQLARIAQQNADTNRIKALQSKTEAGKKLTKGQEQADKDFGKQYADYVAAGGYADVQKNIAQLEGVVEELKKDPSLTGGAMGLLSADVRASTPEWLKENAQKSGAIEQRVLEVVQRNLRLILGAQFTEKEGQLLMKRAYDSRLGAKENIKRVTNLINQMKSKSDQMEATAKVFENQGGTLSGYKATGGLVGGKEAKAKERFNDEDKQAMEWLKKNPNHPKAAEIRKSLGL
jgi:uncharacterized membrane protein